MTKNAPAKIGIKIVEDEYSVDMVSNGEKKHKSTFSVGGTVDDGSYFSTDASLTLGIECVNKSTATAFIAMLKPKIRAIAEEHIKPFLEGHAEELCHVPNKKKIRAALLKPKSAAFEEREKGTKDLVNEGVRIGIKTYDKTLPKRLD